MAEWSYACMPSPTQPDLHSSLLPLAGRALLIKTAELVPRHPGRANRKPGAPTGPQAAAAAAAAAASAAAGPSKQQQAGGSKKKKGRK